MTGKNLGYDARTQFLKTVDYQYNQHPRRLYPNLSLSTLRPAVKNRYLEAGFRSLISAHGRRKHPRGFAGNEYLYNGKELQTELGLGWYDYGFRWYDPEKARFVSVDPLAEKFAYLTTYQYASNDPIAGIDLDGLEKMDFRLAQKFGGFAFDVALKSAASTSQASKFHESRTTQTNFNFIMIPRDMSNNSGLHGRTQVRSEIDIVDYAGGYLMDTDFARETFAEGKKLIIIEISGNSLDEINKLVESGDFEKAKDLLIKTAETFVHESFHAEDYFDGQNDPTWEDHRKYFDATETEIPNGQTGSLSMKDVLSKHPNSISGKTYREIKDYLKTLDLKQLYNEYLEQQKK